MSKRTEKIVLAVVLFNLALIGAAGYGLERRQEEPVGVLFLPRAGAVVFPHRLHVLHGGPGMGCKDCHHDPLSGPTTEMNCRACHYYAQDAHTCETEKIHKRCIGAKCVSCHAREECSHCHSQ